MLPLLKDLIADVGSLYFKPNGFRKNRSRFRRTVGDVLQEVDFQSSQWNSRLDPVRFYINVSVGFLDIPMADGKPALTGSARLTGLVPGAPPHFDLTPENISAVRAELLDSVSRAIEALPTYYGDVREHALRGSHCILPIPSTWKRNR